MVNVLTESLSTLTPTIFLKFEQDAFTTCSCLKLPVQLERDQKTTFCGTVCRGLSVFLKGKALSKETMSIRIELPKQKSLIKV